MGKNKLAKFEELKTFEHVFEVPTRSILGEERFYLKGKWNKCFFKNNHPIVLELGCGKGEYTVELARRYPEQNYIGVDIKGARIWTGAKKSKELGLKNVAFIRADIEMIHCLFSENEINQIWLTFPDPQMKKLNKRLTSTNFIKRYQLFLADKNIVHLKTDSNFMFTYTNAMIVENNFEVLEKKDNVYQQAYEFDVLSIKTYYEEQWLERGMTIKYVAFRIPNKKDLMEPDVEIEVDNYRSFKRNRRTQNEKCK